VYRPPSWRTTLDVAKAPTTCRGRTPSMIAIDAASIGPCVRTIVSAAVRSAPTGRRGGDSRAAGGGAAGGRTRASASRPTRPRSRRTAASASLIVGKAVAPVLAVDVRTAQRTANSIRRRIQRCHVLNGGTRPIVTSAAFHARLETPRRRGLDRRNRRLKRRCARPEPAQLHRQPWFCGHRRQAVEPRARSRSHCRGMRRVARLVGMGQRPALRKSSCC
jgi:hypothetical protein